MYALLHLLEASCVPTVVKFSRTRAQTSGKLAHGARISIVALTCSVHLCRFKAPIGVQELMHFFNATHQSINAHKPCETTSAPTHASADTDAGQCQVQTHQSIVCEIMLVNTQVQNVQDVL